MLSLERIRETKQKNEEEQQKKKENYKSPTGAIIFGRFMKSYNLKLINEFAEENTLSISKKEELIDNYHKLNYYMPTISQSKQKENEFIERFKSHDTLTK